MQLTRNICGLSKLVLILLLLVSFIFGALFSYVWTLGYYARLPSRLGVSIENVKFFVENATFFDFTVLNPSYSTLNVKIDQIKVSTRDGRLHNVVRVEPDPSQAAIEPGNSIEFRSFWNWGGYTAQSVDVIVLASDGSGDILRAQTPFMNFAVTEANFNSSVSVRNFTVTVESMGPTYVNVTSIFLEGKEIVAVSPSLPCTLVNTSQTFTLNETWIDRQDENVTVAVQTLQGYTAYKTVVTPPPVSLSIVREIPVIFNETDTRPYFNISVMNALDSPTYVDISEVEVVVFVNGTADQIVLLNSTEWVADPSPRINPSLIPTRLVCFWDWKRYMGGGATMTVTVHTLQGFQTDPLSDVEIP